MRVAETTMSTQTILFTYDDYLTFPNDGKRYEIIEGELFVTLTPEIEHQRVSRKLARLIDEYVTSNNLGEVFYAPVDLVLSITDVVQPDIVFISAERSHTITKKNIIAAPDLVVEILSESTSKVDRTKKKLLYEKSGVKEYWLADPDNQTIEQFILTGKGFSEGRIHRKGKFVDSKVLKGLRSDAGAVFSV